jgi:hypothetical protein
VPLYLWFWQSQGGVHIPPIVVGLRGVEGGKENALRTAVEIARLRRALREKLRDAVVQGEPEDVIRYARLYLGLDDDETESDRTTPGVEHGPSGS